VVIGQQKEEADPKHGDHRQAEKRRRPKQSAQPSQQAKYGH
jgi:hypothetical protein